ncbi:MAG TPA: hypothetical protein VJN01_00395 [Xanthomonadales bacterium]|nr:hypothetical protein [Xanthomonadales bacterium]
MDTSSQRWTRELLLPLVCVLGFIAAVTAWFTAAGSVSYYLVASPFSGEARSTIASVTFVALTAAPVIWLHHLFPERQKEGDESLH